MFSLDQKLTPLQAQNPKTGVRESARPNTKKLQENAGWSSIAKTALAAFSTVGMGYLILQNLPTKKNPVNIIPTAVASYMGTSAISRTALVIMTTAAVSAFFYCMKKKLTDLSAKNQIHPSLIDQYIAKNMSKGSVIQEVLSNPELDKPIADIISSSKNILADLNNSKTTPAIILKALRENYCVKDDLNDDEFHTINRIIEYFNTLESVVPYSLGSDEDPFLHLIFLIRMLIIRSNPKNFSKVAQLTHDAFDLLLKFNRDYAFLIAQMLAKTCENPENKILANACEEINNKILNSNNSELISQLAIFYAKEENLKPFYSIIDRAWNRFSQNTTLATDFLITCTKSKNGFLQKYLEDVGYFHYGTENNAKIAIACAENLFPENAKIPLKGNKFIIFNACKGLLDYVNYDVEDLFLLSLANKVINSFKKDDNNDQEFYDDIIRSFLYSEDKDIQSDAYNLLNIIINASLVSKNYKTAELIFEHFDFDNPKLYELYQNKCRIIEQIFNDKRDLISLKIFIQHESETRAIVQTPKILQQISL